MEKNLVCLRTEKTISIAHFVHTADSESPCRKLHGHNFRILVSIESEIKEDGMIIDMRIIKNLINSLDHKTVIPDSFVESTLDAVERGSYEIKLDYETANMYIPFSFVKLIEIPFNVVTSETLGLYFLNEIKKLLGLNESKISVIVYESKDSYIIAKNY